MVFVVMAIPLAFSLKHIASEALTVTQVRSFLSDRFGNSARVTQLDVDFDAKPILVRSVVITPRERMQRTAALQSDLAERLGAPLRLQLDQVLLESGAGALEAQREEMRQASVQGAAETARVNALTQMVSLVAGVPADAVTLDRDHHRISAIAAPLPGASVASYRMLEERARKQSVDWAIVIIPPQAQLPLIRFAGGSDTLDSIARENVLTSAWAARRWNMRALAVPGLPEEGSDAPNLARRRALAVAAILRSEGIATVPAPSAGQSFRLAAALEEDLP
jgi:outer membrane protein OmpA-like peptidoglycan-associated protein